MAGEYRPAEIVYFGDSVIFIGDISTVDNDLFLLDNNIKLIVNASNNDSAINKLYIPTVFIKDFQDITFGGHPNERMLKGLYCGQAMKIGHKLADIIDAAGKINILVHCAAGVNRSAFVIAFYLRKYKNLSPENVFMLLHESNIKKRKTEFLTNPYLREIIINFKSNSE